MKSNARFLLCRDGREWKLVVAYRYEERTIGGFKTPLDAAKEIVKVIKNLEKEAK